MDINKYYHSGSEWTWEKCQRRCTPHFPELYKWNLNIKCSLVLYPGHSGRGITHLHRMQLVYYKPHQLGYIGNWKEVAIAMSWKGVLLRCGMWVQVSVDVTFLFGITHFSVQKVYRHRNWDEGIILYHHSKKTWCVIQRNIFRIYTQWDLFERKYVERTKPCA